jgi:hypothetical protein
MTFVHVCRWHSEGQELPYFPALDTCWTSGTVKTELSEAPLYETHLVLDRMPTFKRGGKWRKQVSNTFEAKFEYEIQNLPTRRKRKQAHI